MEYSKLFELLLSIPKEDLSDLIKFARLSVNTLPNTDIRVLEFLLERVYKSGKKDGNIEMKSEEIIFRTFFGNLDPEQSRIRWNHIKNRLTDSINRYISMIQIEKHPNIKNRILLEYYQNNQLRKNFNAHIKKAQKTLESSSDSFDKEYHRFNLHEIALKKEDQHTHMEEIIMMNTTLDDFYFENKFRVLVELYNRNRIINSKLPKEPILEWISPKEISLKNKKIQIFHKLFLMMKEPENLEHYAKAKKLFYENDKNNTIEYQQTICEYLMNQCIYYCHIGHLEFAEEYIEYVKYLIENELFSSQTGFSISKYSNTVYMALISNDLEWAKDFVEKYSSFVDHQHINSIKQLNLANIFFYKGENDKALNLLVNYNYFELYFKIIYDKLYIKLFFEGRIDISLKSKLAAFEKFIKRSKKLPPIRKTKNLNFVKAVRYLNSNNQKAEQFLKDDYLILDFLWLEKKREEHNNAVISLS